MHLKIFVSRGDHQFFMAMDPFGIIVHLVEEKFRYGKR